MNERKVFICEVWDKRSGKLIAQHEVTFARTEDEARAGFGMALADYPAAQVDVTWREKEIPAQEG